MNAMALLNSTSRNCTAAIANESSCDVMNLLPPWYHNAFNVVFVVLYILIIIAALIGNILVCVAVSINSNLRQNVSSYFIVSLAISDIGTACLSMTFDLEQFITKGKWYHGEAFCIIWTTAYLITVPSSMWNLFVLSIDRYKKLKNPWNKFKESHSMTARRAAITIAVLWFYCFGFALIPVMGWKAYPKSIKNNYCRFNISVGFSIIGSVFNFYLPMFAMCFIYYKVYQIAHAHTTFPLALKRRYDNESGNGGSGASTLNPLESLGRLYIDQHQTLDSTNQETANRDVVGLENVSFCLEEGTEKKMISPEAKSIGKEKETATDSVYALCANPLQASDINDAGLDIQIHSNYYAKSCNDSEAVTDSECLCQHYHGLKSCDNLDNNSKYLGKQSSTEITFKGGNDEESKEKSKNKSLRSAKEISVLNSELHSSVERDECATKEKSNLEMNHTSASEKIVHSADVDKDIEQINTGPINEGNEEKQKSSDNKRRHFSLEKAKLNTLSLNSFKRKRFFSARCQESKCVKDKFGTKSSSPLCKTKRKFPLSRALKNESEAMNDNEACSLRKFHRKSVENPGESRGSRRKLSSQRTGWRSDKLEGASKPQQDSLARSDQRCLKHLSKNTKAARTISIIVGAFLVCWMPFTTMSIVYNICSVPCFTLIPPEIVQILLWIGYVNSALNPILFSYRNMQFKKSYKRIAFTLLPCLSQE